MTEVILEVVTGVEANDKRTALFEICVNEAAP
jgi:hypothetical protein